VEVAEGTLRHHGTDITIVDLPGTYSLASASADEEVTCHFIERGKADVIVNVVDATALERNLNLTLTLLETGMPMVMALNFMDEAAKKGIKIDVNAFTDSLRIPVIPIVAIEGRGVHELVDKALKVAKKKTRAVEVDYGPEVEARVERLVDALPETGRMPKRWVALQLLEGDNPTLRRMKKNAPEVIALSSALSRELEGIFKEPMTSYITSRRFAQVGKLSRRATKTHASTKGPHSYTGRFDALSLHPVWGYALMFVVMLSILVVISILGNIIARGLQDLFEAFNPHSSSIAAELAWNGGVVGLYASLGVAFGFLLPFYFILSFLENSGYLPRVAFLMDRPCHAIGLHGKASIPLIVGFGCNVPACIGCRIIETKRDRLLTTFLSTLIPCSARTVVILGIVGTYMGPQWAVLMYVLDFILIIAVGKIMSLVMKGRSPGMIMEMPPFRKPVPRLVAKQAWSRFRPFLKDAIPLIIAGSMAIEGLRIAHMLDEIYWAISPLTVLWLGLPAFTGALFILGIMRKEAAVALLGVVAGTMDIPSLMSPVQMFVFTLVMMLYIPCLATISVLGREIGWKNTALITVGEIGLALFVGGIAYRLLSFLM
jgi:ferrous iron transport protein B